MKNEGTTEQTEMDNTENEVPPETRNEVRKGDAGSQKI